VRQLGSREASLSSSMPQVPMLLMRSPSAPLLRAATARYVMPAEEQVAQASSLVQAPEAQTKRCASPEVFRRRTCSTLPTSRAVDCGERSPSPAYGPQCGGGRFIRRDPSPRREAVAAMEMPVARQCGGALRVPCPTVVTALAPQLRRQSLSPSPLRPPPRAVVAPPRRA